MLSKPLGRSNDGRALIRSRAVCRFARKSPLEIPCVDEVGSDAECAALESEFDSEPRSPRYCSMIVRVCCEMLRFSRAEHSLSSSYVSAGQSFTCNAGIGIPFLVFAYYSMKNTCKMDA